MSERIKKLVHYFGSLLAILGIAFVGYRFQQYSTQIDFYIFDSVKLLWVFIFAILYGFANLLLALAWWCLLVNFDDLAIKKIAIKVYGLSQIAKYVPGNIMHIAGRQALGLSAGIKGWALAKASFWEIMAIATTGSLYIMWIIPLYVEAVTPVSALVLSILVIICIFFFFNYISHPHFFDVLLLQVCFLLISGLIFTGVLVVFKVFPVSSINEFVVFSGAFIVSWLVGFVTPGAPAGVGVREMVIIILLGGMADEASLLTVVVISRIITVIGDLLFYSSMYFIRNNRNVV